MRVLFLALVCALAASFGPLARSAEPAPAGGVVRFDFETGDLQGWKVVEGHFARTVTDRAEYHNKGAYASRQGQWHLSTVEGPGDVSADPQTGVLESPVFVLQAPTMSFLIGGGNAPDTYLALCTLDGREVLKASGRNSEVMERVQWQADKWVGQRVFLRIVDANVGGWGHVTFDDFSAQGQLDPVATQEHFAKRKNILARIRAGTLDPRSRGGAPAFNPAAVSALRAAIEDLSATFGVRYPDGKSYLARLDELDKALDAGGEAAAESTEKFQELQREALVANPLVSGQPIVFTARAQYAAVYHAIDTLFQVGEATDGKYTRGGALKLLNPLTGETKTLIEEAQGMIRSPCVHFSGQKILFAMRRTPQENLHIFEINADGTGLRPLTSAAGVSDFDPIYLPDDSIVFSSTREPKFNMCSQDIGANLFRMENDGANIHQITKSTLFENQASLAPDGRILYKRWEYVDRNFGDAHGFWSVNPDGSNQAIVWGNNKADPAAVYYPRLIPGTDRLLCILSTHHGNMWGALGIIDPRIDTDRNASILRTWPAGIKNTLTDNDAFNCDRLGGVHPKYEDPWPLSDKYFLCSRQSGNGQMAIYLVDTFDHEVLLHAEAPGCFGAMPLQASARPPLLAARRDFTSADGLMYVQNVYLGTHMQGVKPGTVKKIRIVESPEKRGWTPGKWFGQGFQAPGMNWHDFTAKRIIGMVPVETDGSAYFRVPSDRFIFFQLLDENDMMIQTMRSGTVVQSGERIGCVGCHDRRLSAPPVEQAMPLALTRAPSQPRPWYDQGRNFSYLAEVQPVFDKHCLACHDFGKPGAGKLILARDRDPFFNAAYTQLQRKRYITVIGAGPAGIQAPYAWGSHPSKIVQMLRAGHHELKLDKESLDRIVTWIDLNAPYYPTYYSAFPDNPGGRSPLADGPLNRLGQLTGVNWGGEVNFASNTGPWVSFDRPELSPCLAKLAPTTPAYQEALTLIRNGQAALARQPRGDTEDFVPCARDRQRESFYAARVAAELKSRQAIRENKKVYDY